MPSTSLTATSSNAFEQIAQTIIVTVIILRFIRTARAETHRDTTAFEPAEPAEPEGDVTTDDNDDNDDGYVLVD
ncbi:hypothetical protein RRF57_006753 [Xylaria bambusicola]|uniref:Uncharacterized protein n=1 Tax=Xylaria bambusicola TaxID=326684 RepID=A0AAN7UQV0_9PEZI